MSGEPEACFILACDNRLSPTTRPGQRQLHPQTHISEVDLTMRVLYLRVMRES